MAQVKISDLPTDSQIQDNDLFVVVDNSTGTGVTKQIQASQLKLYTGTGGSGGAFDPAKIQVTGGLTRSVDGSNVVTIGYTGSATFDPNDIQVTGDLTRNVNNANVVTIGYTSSAIFDPNDIQVAGSLTRSVNNANVVTIGFTATSPTAGDGIDINGTTISTEASKRTFDVRNAYNDDSTEIPAWTFVVADEDFVITDGASVDYAGYKKDVAHTATLGAPGGITRVAIPAASGGNSGRAKDAVITEGIFDIVTTVNLGAVSPGSKLYLRETIANNRKSWTLQTTYQAGDLLVGRFLNSTGTNNEYTVEMDFDLARHAGNTDQIPEGETNKFFTNANFDNRLLENDNPAKVAARITDNTSIVVDSNKIKANVANFVDSTTIIVDSNKIKANIANFVDNARIILDSSGKISANIQQFHNKDIAYAFDREIFDSTYFSHDNAAKSMSLVTGNVVTAETVYTVTKSMFTGDVFVKDDTGRTITVNLAGVVNENDVFAQVANIFQGTGLSKYDANNRIVVEQGSGSGGNVSLGTFVARSTPVNKSQDGFLVYDNNDLARRSWDDIENNLDLATTKEQGWINYRIRSENSGLVRGDIVLPTINVNDAPNAAKKVYIYPKEEDIADIAAVLQRRFLLMAQVDGTRFTQFVVTSVSPTVTSGVYAVDTQARFISRTGAALENNQTVSFFSFGRMVAWDSIEPNANTTTDLRFSSYSVQATRDYVGYTGNLHMDAKLSQAAANANLAYDNIHADLEILTDNTTAVQSNVNILQANLAANTATLQDNINIVSGNVSSSARLDVLTDNINTVQGNVTANITTLQTNIDTVSSNVGSASYGAVTSVLREGDGIDLRFNDTNQTVSIESEIKKREEIYKIGGQIEYVTAYEGLPAKPLNNSTVFTDSITIDANTTTQIRPEVVFTIQKDGAVSPREATYYLQKRELNGEWSNVVTQSYTQPNDSGTRSRQLKLELPTKLDTPAVVGSVSYRGAITSGVNYINLVSSHVNARVTTGVQGQIRQFPYISNTSPNLSLDRPENSYAQAASGPIFSFTPSALSNTIDIIFNFRVDDVGFYSNGYDWSVGLEIKKGNGSWENLFRATRGSFGTNRNVYRTLRNYTIDSIDEVQLRVVIRNRASKMTLSYYNLDIIEYPRNSVEQSFDNPTNNIEINTSDEVYLKGETSGTQGQVTLTYQRKANSESNWSNIATYIYSEPNGDISIPGVIDKVTSNSNYDYRLLYNGSKGGDLYAAVYPAGTLTYGESAFDALNTRVNAVSTIAGTQQSNINLVQANLTANTATLQNNINLVTGNINSIQSNINSVSSNVATNITDIDTIFTDLDTIQGNVNSTQSNVNTVSGNVDSKIGTANTKIDNLGDTLTANVNQVQANLTANLANVSTNSHTIANTYPTASFAIDKINDKLIITDNSSNQVFSLPLVELDAIVTPVELLQDTLSGYTYKLNIPGTGLAKGEVHVTETGGQDAIYVNPLDKDRNTLQKIFDSDYRVRLQQSASVYIEGVATSILGVQGASFFILLDANSVEETGTFADLVDTSIITEGKHPDRSEVDYLTITNNKKKIPSSKAVVDAQATIVSNVNTVNSNLATLQSNINSVQSNVATNITDINTIFTDLDTIQGNVNSTQSNVTIVNSNVNTGLATITSNVNTVNSNVNTGLATITNNVNTVNSNINTLAVAIVSNTNTVQANLTSGLATLQNNINTVSANGGGSGGGNVTLSQLNQVQSNVNYFVSNTAPFSKTYTTDPNPDNEGTEITVYSDGVEFKYVSNADASYQYATNSNNIGKYLEIKETLTANSISGTINSITGAGATYTRIRLSNVVTTGGSILNSGVAVTIIGEGFSGYVSNQIGVTANILSSNLDYMVSNTTAIPFSKNYTMETGTLDTTSKIYVRGTAGGTNGFLALSKQANADPLYDFALSGNNVGEVIQIDFSGGAKMVGPLGSAYDDGSSRQTNIVNPTIDNVGSGVSLDGQTVTVSKIGLGGFLIDKINNVAANTSDSSSVSADSFEGSAFITAHGANTKVYFDIVNGSINTDELADGGVVRNKIGSNVFATTTEVREATIADAAMSPVTHKNRSAELNRETKFTGYNATSNTNLQVGEYKIVNNVLTIRPKSADRTSMAAQMFIGQIFSSENSNRTIIYTTNFSGAVTVTDTDYTINLNSTTLQELGTLGDNNTLYIEGRRAYDERQRIYEYGGGTIGNDSVGLDQLNLIADGSTGYVLTRTSSGITFSPVLVPKTFSKSESKSAGNIPLSTSYQVLPRTSSNGSDSQGEISITPQATSSKFRLEFRSTVGNLPNSQVWTNTNKTWIGYQFQRRIGNSGSWTTIFENNAGMIALGQQNLPVMFDFIDEPSLSNLTTPVQYRFRANVDTNDSRRGSNIEGGLFVVTEYPS